MHAIACDGFGRGHPDVTNERLLEKLPGAWTARYDEHGSRRARLSVGAVQLMVVIDEVTETIVTVWVG
jgi:hypothetical protein